jgi:shikimate kinase
MVRSIAIGGFMGVGKTTVGRCLADRLSVPFLDLDETIERQAGRPVSAIFETEGEVVFRRYEAAALHGALQREPTIIALGGGTLHHGSNCADVCAQADLICLGMPFIELQQRLGDSDKGRPLWENRETLFAKRAAVYRDSGTYINVSGLTTDAVVDRIERAMSCA